MVDNGRKLGYFAGFMKFWKPIIAIASACLAGGLEEATAQETPEPEMLQIRYMIGDGSGRDTIPRPFFILVEKDIERLHIDDLPDVEGDNRLEHLILPEGLTKLHTLKIGNASHFSSTTLKLPKDIGKDADWPFRLAIGWSELRELRVHGEMSPFEVFTTKDRIPTRISAAKELIKNRTPNADGLFIIRLNYYYGVKFIEVYGVDPQIWLNRQEGGVEIVWDRGTLQSAPSIDGPWTDITFDDTRRLFLRSSSPAEFFRVKP